MDCGWRNPEWGANNHFEYLKSLRSNELCMERAARPQTSGMRDVLSLSAMMTSFELTSNVRTTVMRVYRTLRHLFFKLRRHQDAWVRDFKVRVRPVRPPNTPRICR